VPLDAHLELFHAARKHAEAIGDEVTLRRTDLALFDLDVAQRTITCNLVEVKCSAQSLGLSGYNQLKENITEQLNQELYARQHHRDGVRSDCWCQRASATVGYRDLPLQPDARLSAGVHLDGGTEH
jgi:hypothetical protein